MTVFASKSESRDMLGVQAVAAHLAHQVDGFVTVIRVVRAAAGFFALAVLMPAVAQAQTAAAPVSTSAPAQKPPYQEKIDDWQLVCVGEAKDKRCSLVKEMTDEKAGQRIVALELGMNGDRLEGAAVLPFGIELARGLTIRFKDSEPGTTVAFQTCLPAGCLAPLSFDLAAVKQLGQSKTLFLSVGLPSGETANFTIPVAGLEKAQARLRVLSKLNG